MESIRQQKVAKLLQKELAEIFQQMGSALSSGKMLTVTVVRVSPDLLEAKVYISIFPSKNAEQVIEQIRANTGEIRNQVGKRLKNALRRIPNLTFHIDDNLDYAEHIDDLLKS